MCTDKALGLNCTLQGLLVISLMWFYAGLLPWTTMELLLLYSSVWDQNQALWESKCKWMAKPYKPDPHFVNWNWHTSTDCYGQFPSPDALNIVGNTLFQNEKLFQHTVGQILFIYTGVTSVELLLIYFENRIWDQFSKPFKHVLMSHWMQWNFKLSFTHMLDWSGYLAV